MEEFMYNLPLAFCCFVGGIIAIGLIAASLGVGRGRPAGSGAVWLKEHPLAPRRPRRLPKK